MCWRMNRISSPQANVSDNDVRVYKVLHYNYADKLTSPYMGKEYNIGETYSVGSSQFYLSTYNSFYWYIDVGFHSYSTDVFFGRHSYKGMDSLLVKNIERDTCNPVVVGAYTYSNNFKVFECHIPAGTQYYINDDNEIVSESIVIDRDITEEVVKDVEISTAKNE